MKKVGVYIITLALVLALLPQTIVASVTSTLDQDLAAYLQEVSNTRGFEVTKDDVNSALSIVNMTIDDFNSIEDLKLKLGDVIKADYSNLSTLLNEYQLTQPTVIDLLSQYGEELEDYIYENDLDTALSLYSAGSTEQDANFETDLATYLSNISSIRGFEVTKEYIDTYLADKSMSYEDFSTVTELSEFLGDAIMDDLSNLDYFETDYGMTQEDVIDYLESNDMSISDFVYLEEVEEYLLESYSNPFSLIDTQELYSMLDQFGIKQDEIQNILDYYASQEDYLNSDEILAKLEDLSTRMGTFSEKLMEEVLSDENYIPSKEDINEAISYYEDILSIFKLSVELSIVDGDKETPITLLQLASLSSLTGDVKITVYGENGQLLLDANLTKEFLMSQIGSLIEAADEFLNSDEGTKTTQTVKGGKLPDTASNYMTNALIGTFISFAGLFIFLKVRKKQNEVLSEQ